MAELTPPLDDRGQLLLVFAIGLAVAFVTLALILNAAIVTELQASTATQGLAAERAITTYEHDVWSGVAGLLGSVNAQENASIDQLRADVANGTHTWNELAQRQHADDGRLTNVTLLDTAAGTRIVQHNQTRTVTNRTGAADWTMVGDASRVRGFWLNVTQDGLVPGDSSCAECFNVTMTDGETRRSIHIYADGEDIVVEQPSTGDTCRGGNESMFVDLTNGSVDGRHCSALEFATAVESPHELAITNGDRAEARYELIVDADIPFDPHFSETDAPTLEPAVYSATVRVGYRSNDVRYETAYEVMPGGER